MNNANSCRLSSVTRALMSILLALVLSVAMVPAAAVEAFATANGSSEAEAQDFSESGSSGGTGSTDALSLDGVSDKPVDVSGDSGSADADAVDDGYDDGGSCDYDYNYDYDEDPFFFDDEEAVEQDPDAPTYNSFRYGNSVEESGIATYALRSISTDTPSTFVPYDRGYHTRSDALCGIDVSEHQGSINWTQVKAAGIDFAIVRSSDGYKKADGTRYNDGYFVSNIKGCINNGIPFGVYHYARATTVAEAEEEAKQVLTQLKAAGVTTSNISYPIYYDIEETKSPNYGTVGKSQVAEIAKAFISAIHAAGYDAGVYSNQSSLETGFCSSSYITSLKYLWCAQYNANGLQYGFGNSSSGGDALKNNGRGIWQFTSSGKVNGISGNVDLNYSYLGKFSGSATVKIGSIDSAGGTFKVAVSGISANQTVSKVLIPVWCSSTGGQDDIKWYTATKASDGSYYVNVSVRDHKGQVGTYTAHAYIYSRTGQSFVVGTSSAVNVATRSFSATVASDELSVQLAANGGEYARASVVKFAVWSAKGGQDDLVWYYATKSGNTWQATANMHNHRVVGSYNVHAYATINGTSSYVEAKTFTISSYKDLGISMYRLYNPNSGEHFYTSSTSERDNLVRVGWKYEGIGWKAATKSSTPVYRLYSGTDHHYTTNVTERNNLVKIGWKYEGIGWYSDDAKSVALYCQYNPYVNPQASRNNSGSHNYTSDKSEIAMLVRCGWRAEGICWYGLK